MAAPQLLRLLVPATRAGPLLACRLRPRALAAVVSVGLGDRSLHLGRSGDAAFWPTLARRPAGSVAPLRYRAPSACLAAGPAATVIRSGIATDPVRAPLSSSGLGAFFRGLLHKYGRVGIAVYIAVDIVTLAAVYGLMKFDWDITALLRSLHLERIGIDMSSISPRTSIAVATFAIYKVAQAAPPPAPRARARRHGNLTGRPRQILFPVRLTVAAVITRRLVKRFPQLDERIKQRTTDRVKGSLEQLRVRAHARPARVHS